LWRSSGFTLIVVAILAVTVGAITVSFTLVKSVLLDGLPYPESNRLVVLGESNPALGLNSGATSPANLLDWRDLTTSFEGITAYWNDSEVFLTEDRALEISVVKVTEDFFKVLGTPASVGRLPTEEEMEDEARVVVVSDRFYRSQLGSESQLGTDILLGTETWKVIGVLPASFSFPEADVEVWRPWSMMRHYASDGGVPRETRWLTPVARLKPGVSLEAGTADLTAVAAQLADDYPQDNKGWEVHGSSLQDVLIGDSGETLWPLLGAALLVLLIACANVSSLLQVRAVGRQQETAIRQAMGASRTELLSLFAGEGFLLGFLGGVVGIVLSLLGLRLLLAYQPGNLPRVEEITLDSGVLLFALAVSLLAGGFLAILPFLQIPRRQLARSLTSGGSRSATAGRSTHLFRRSLTVAEVVLAVILLVGAGLLVRSFLNLKAVDPGFKPEGLLSFTVRLNNEYAPRGGDLPAVRYFETLADKLEALPEVESAAAATVLPMNDVGSDFDRPYWRPGAKPADGEVPEAMLRMVTPGFFSTMGMELRGREFGDGERMGSLPVTIINETLAQKAFGGADPLGRELVIDYLGRQDAYQIVGIVKNPQTYGLRSESVAESYLPHAQVPYMRMNTVARTSGAPEALMGTVRRTLFELDPAQPAFNMETMEDRVEASVARDRFSMGLLVFLAAIALTLAALGIYGLLAFSVRQRTQEIGVRMALGASRQSILGGVVGESLKLVLGGTLLGIVLSLFAARFMSSLLFGVEAVDPLTFILVAIVLALTAALAGYLPARRATRIDVVRALND